MRSSFGVIITSPAFSTASKRSPSGRSPKRLRSGNAALDENVGECEAVHHRVALEAKTTGAHKGSEFSFGDIDGTLIGLWSPGFWDGSRAAARPSPGSISRLRPRRWVAWNASATGSP
jgi:hypothetical protein